jgi:hypothetical protein
MVLVHNVIIRGLNSIYKQALHVKSEDYADFIAYATCWCEFTDSKRLPISICHLELRLVNFLN